MSLALRCGKCRNFLDDDDLFCPTCGHETPAPEDSERGRTGTMDVYQFDCEGCGASLTWDIETQGMRCAFCGEERLRPVPERRKVPAPDKVVPFKVSQGDAEGIFRAWVGRGFFRPSDIQRRSTLTEMRAVYLPYWAFRGDCHTYWTADSDATPAFANAAWAPHFGEHEWRYRGVIVPASGSLTLEEVRAIDPYDLAAGVPHAEKVLGGRPAEAFAVTRKRARLLGRRALESLEAEACAGQVPGSRFRNLHINVLVTGLWAVPVLLPVWIMAYSYRGHTYRFLVNGQTGSGSGSAPISVWKVLLVVLAAIVGVALLAAGALGIAMATS